MRSEKSLSGSSEECQNVKCGQRTIFTKETEKEGAEHGIGERE